MIWGNARHERWLGTAALDPARPGRVRQCMAGSLFDDLGTRKGRDALGMAGWDMARIGLAWVHLMILASLGRSNARRGRDGLGAAGCGMAWVH